MKELTPGLELGARFVLVRRIGRGGSAEVWLAVDRERGERVALKFFDEALAGDAVRRARLEAEVAQAKTLPAGFTVAACHRSMASAALRSAATATARPPVSRATVSAARRIASPSRDAIDTAAPSAANARATAYPSPLLAPPTIAILFFSPRSIAE